MSASQPANFNLQEFTDVGQLLVGGRLYTYAYGTTAQKIAYTDPDGTVPHTYTADGAGGQYIALNARGELPAPLYLGDGSYDIALKRADGSTVWTRKADGVDNHMNALAGPTGSSLIGFIQSGTGAVVRLSQDKLRESPTPQDFGAVGDGVADDTNALNAWAVAVSKVGLGYVPAAQYKVPVGFPAPKKSTVVCAVGAVFDLSSGSDGVVGLQAYGSVGNMYNLTATPTLYGNTVTLSASDAANFSANDFAEVVSDDVADVSDRTGTPVGEMVQIGSVSGGTITLQGYLRCPIAYASNPRIRKINFFEGLEWHGGEFRGRTTGADPAQIGVYGKYARRINTYDVFCNATMGIGHLWEHAFDCWANNSHTVDNRRPFAGYSIAVGYTSQSCGARGGNFVRSRHAFTTTGGTSDFGIPMDCGITGAHSRYAIGDDFDTHSIGINIFMLDCVSEFCAGSALNIETHDVRARIRAFHPAQHGVAISNYARALGNYDIEAEVTNAGQSIMRFDAGVIPANQVGLSRLTAKLNGTSVGSAIDIIWNSALVLASNIKLSGSVKSDVSNNAVTLSYCKDVDLTGLKVECTNASASAIKLDNVDGADLRGARGDLAPNSTGISFYVNTNCSNVDLRETKGRSPSAVNSRGISLDSTATYCAFGDMSAARFIGHTTPINISGAGTGHVGTLTGSAAYDPPSLAGGAKQQTTVAVPQAAVGDMAEVSFSQTNVNIRWHAEVTSSSSVTVTQENLAAGSIDLGAGTLKVLARKTG